MFAALALLIVQPAPTAEPEQIIVVGRRAERALEACLARACPPAEEVEASLQASVEQFADGRYVDARRTLRRAIGRNRQHAAEMPGPVSSLYATLATVAEHEGDMELMQRSGRNNVTILREHVGRAHPATLVQELNFADSMIGMGAPVAADAQYRAVQTTAAAAGRREIAAGAAFRRAWLALMRDKRRDAERLADEAVAIMGPDDRMIGDLREILRARIALKRGDEGAIERLAARISQPLDGPPRLLYAPPVDDINPRREQGAVEADPFHDTAIRFADVGYWIRPDGRTADAEVLRTSGLGQWGPGIVRQVGARRYVPLQVEPGSPGIYRIDRFTVRAEMGIPTGSRIRQRMGPLSVHVIDLTETDAMNEAHRARTGDAEAGGARVAPAARSEP